MRCCVTSCKNDSRRINKSQGITFHVFPTEPTLRAAWIKALGRDSWEPRERTTVCSEHFHTEDLYQTKSGLRKVRAGAMPVMMNLSSCNYEKQNQNDLKVCRICLATDGCLYSMAKFKLDEAYENLTGTTMRQECLPQYLCVECSHRLVSCDKFRSKSLRAQTILLEVAKNGESLSTYDIQSINRQQNNLLSTIRTKHFPPDHFDDYTYHEEKPEPELTDVNLDADYEVKNENNEVFINEDEFGVKDEDFTVRDYSTDDSLPLERQRTKKVKKVKKTTRKPKEITEPKIDRRRKPFLNGDLNETLFTITDLTFEEQVAEIQKRQESSNYKNSVFKCTVCFKGFLDQGAYSGHMTRHTDVQVAEIQKRQESSNYKNSVFKCTVCFKGFLDQGAYSGRMTRHTDQCGEYECDICKTHFKSPHALRKHITAHHTQRFSCNQCPYVTTHRQTARLHERWHKGTKYQCPHCLDEFVKFTTYMGHVRIKHPSDFVCELCGYSFVSEKGIELHKKLKHRLDNGQIPPDGPYCELCKVRFVSVEAHAKHLRVSARHNAEPKELNKGNKGRRPREMERERSREKSREPDKKQYPSQIRKAEGPIPCEQCGVQLEDSRAYHGHFRRMHPDKNRTKYPSMKSPCMCEVCGRMFQSYALLKDHTWTHTGEKPFACEQCGKAFRMKQRLVAHRRVHAQRRHTYCCALCGKHFSTHSNRQRHMFIHTGLKPFKCEMCGKCFKHASEKRAHITYVHLKKPWPKRARAKRRTDRPGQLQPQGSLQTSASEMDIVQPLWPCDPKMAEINPNIMDDKPMYYNLKI